MTVITVAGILMALGVPGMVTVVQNNRILATSNDFISAVHAGRMESIKRRSTVVLCASADPEAATPSCSNDFSAGWIVFVDRDENGQVDVNADPTLDDTVLV
ncbi:MAG: GspH/FimT family protein, partial [Gammaproteobacteria bacterium]|nr:GspH/FimT family protein [Gammaproteobacteria bacterium]